MGWAAEVIQEIFLLLNTLHRLSTKAVVKETVNVFALYMDTCSV